MNDKLLFLIVGIICLIIGALIGYFIPRREKYESEKVKKLKARFNSKLSERKSTGGIGAPCALGIRCPHLFLTCWPKAVGKCYLKIAGKGDPCIHAGSNKIICGPGQGTCSSKKKGHPKGTMGVCE